MVAGAVEEEAEEELAEVVEAVVLEEREEEEVEVGASEEGEAAVVVSEGEDIKYNNCQKLQLISAISCVIYFYESETCFLSKS